MTITPYQEIDMAVRLPAELRANIEETYPGPGGKREREAAFAAARAYLATELDAVGAGAQLAEARAALKDAMAAARIVALLEIEGGAFEKYVAQDLGVDRMTVRDWQGKRRR
ncbi:HTH DNA binding protein [Mycobacterium phage Aminay]|uniref:Helix-turn-helix DNA binding domain protein n=1 Tax=Mycobacterium phage Aminay TaxID=2250291 RepID=A0A345KV25_9CAUD|nr:HTH DNA binding protein [Mycobacterium phage Aminay]AXH46877.1 helix-turn-helix DNA binding domain protein [Mycobacterium phage Aminay]